LDRQAVAAGRIVSSAYTVRGGKRASACGVCCQAQHLFPVEKVDAHMLTFQMKILSKNVES
jgi:hypothetical protein